MIWTFEQKVDDDAEGRFFDHSECDDKFPWDNDSNYQSKLKVDWVGLKAWQKRKENGFRLFGIYYEALWD